MSTLDDIQVMREHIYDHIAGLAKGMDGADVVRLLQTISEDVYEAGIDQVFADAKVKNRDNVADAFDFTWLTQLAIKISEFKARQRSDVAQQRRGRVVMEKALSYGEQAEKYLHAQRGPHNIEY